jgi:hypothetical protein
VPLPSAKAQHYHELLGAHVAFFLGDTVYANSFSDLSDKDKEALNQVLKEHSLSAAALESQEGLSDIVTVSFKGVDYIASAVRLPRYSSALLPSDDSKPLAGLLVLKALPTAP